MMPDFTDMPLDELQELLAAAQEELNARTLADQYGAKIDQVIREYASAAGRDLEDGAEYVPPSGAHNAYPKGAIVTYEGKTWRATRAGANGVPGQSPDWWLIPEEGEIPAWSQPHAGTEYELGAIVTHNGHVWENTHDVNGWEPGTQGSQWKDLGPIEEYDPSN